MNTLHLLSRRSKIVADTSNFESIAKYRPLDATTNPSLILQAVRQPQYQRLINRVLKENKNNTIAQLIDCISVAFGVEILKLIEGRVSTEVAADLSFDVAASVRRAKNIIDLYQKVGIGRERVLIKLVSTWEGIQAASILESEGIHCNLTLLFSLSQAMVCAQEKVTLISPFVGRILDWHKSRHPNTDFDRSKDPGVQSVTQIYQYYKKHQIATEVMAASFRNIGEIIELAGCDLLTISPSLLEQLQNSSEKVPLKLSKESGIEDDNTPRWQQLSEAQFRLFFNADSMAVEKLAQGINKFIADQKTLELLLKDQMS